MEGRVHRFMDPLEGTMSGTPKLGSISTRRQRIAKLAREDPERSLVSLAHYIDIGWLRRSFDLTRKDGATGVDGRTAQEYAEGLEENLEQLLNRLKSGTYKAPPVRRARIPKGDGHETRSIGIPTLEDRILQRAVLMVLEAVYEQDFLDCSYGFRPGRSAHQALRTLRDGLMQMQGGWILDADVRSFFDEMDHAHLRAFLDRRVRDGVIRRVIGKWLNAGVMDGGVLSYPSAGTPQGGVISPLLANVFLHEVIDKWFAEEVVPRLRGRAFMVRYADDFVLVFEYERDARRVYEVLAKRLARFGLRLHPDKTRLVPFRRPPKAGGASGRPGPGTFDMLGFTHYWGKSKRGHWVVKQKTAMSRMRRGLKALNVWCRRHRHAPLPWQALRLNRHLLGQYGYYGVCGNYECLRRYRSRLLRIWHQWLGRRSQKGYLPWDAFERLLARYPLARPRIRHVQGTIV